MVFTKSEGKNIVGMFTLHAGKNILSITILHVGIQFLYFLFTLHTPINSKVMPFACR